MVDEVSAKLERIERHLIGLVERTMRLTYTKKGAAILLSVGVTTISGMVRRGEIATARVGARRMIPLSELLRIATPEQAKAMRAATTRPRRQLKSTALVGHAASAKAKAALKRL